MSDRKFSKRTHTPGAMYHVTLHSAARTVAFEASTNKSEYLSRIANYLSPRESRNSSRHRYADLRGEVRVLTYCLLDDHVHLPVHDITGDGMSNLMHRVNTSYSHYFNKRHSRRGPLFDAPFAAKPIADRNHARAVIAYTHLNHVEQQLDWRHCGHRAFMGDDKIDWLDVETALDLFGGRAGYVRYMNRNGPAIIRRKLEEKGIDPFRHRYRPIKWP